MQWALAHGYAVFPHDHDFGTMLARSGDAGPSVVQLRCLNVLPEAIGPGTEASGLLAGEN